MSVLSDSPTPLTELRELLEQLCDGSLAPDGYTRIEQLVQADQAATDFYIDYVWLHGELHWQLAPLPPDGRDDEYNNLSLLMPSDVLAEPIAETEPAPSLSPLPTAGPPVLGFLSEILSGLHLSPRTMMLMLAGALAGYFLVVMALIPLARSLKPSAIADLAGPAEPGRQGRKVGVVSAEPQTHWSSKTPAFTDAAARVGERYELASGRVQINLLHGTRVIVEGPASWHLESEQRFHLNSGQLSAVVPKPAVGFAVVTPVAEIVDLGTEFDVLVHLGGKTDVHVQRGSVEVKRVQTDGKTKVPAGATVPDVVTLSAGGAVSVVSGRPVVAIPFEPHWLRAEQAAAARGNVPFDPKSKIWLGNLFDDPRGTPLARAMETDALCATPEVHDLGIQRVIHAGDWSEGPVGGDWVNGTYQPDGLIQIAPHVSFDFASLGWRGKLRGSIANDALGKFDVLPNGGPLSTRGVISPTDGPKLEEGIGMHGDSLITFDLAQIRAAGGLVEQSLEFVCDRIGMNDDEIASRELASFHMVVLVSDDTSVQAAIVDGSEQKLDERADIWSIASPPAVPMRADGRFIPLRLPIPRGAKYLTLVVTSFNDNNSMDHGVWSGARLEVARSGAP